MPRRISPRSRRQKAHPEAPIIKLSEFLSESYQVFMGSNLVWGSAILLLGAATVWTVIKAAHPN